MKRGNTGVIVLVIVAVVLGLSLVLILSDNSQPVGRVVAPMTFECQTNADCQSEQVEYCDSGQAIACVQGSCACINPCQEGSLCDTSPSEGEIQCGGASGNPIAPKPCLPNNPVGPFSVGIASGQNEGACDCDNDGCTEGAQCAVFGVTVDGDSFPNPCGPNGHCVPTGGSDDGLIFGQCACGPKECQFTEDDDKDQCPGTVKCNEGTSCTTGAQCGGPGVGRCVECNSNSDCPGEGNACINSNCINSNPSKRCDCDCVSWAPCQEDEHCGPVGDCITGPDGVFECMCASEFGCSFDQCKPGITPCNDSSDCFGGSCQTTDGIGICQECGVECDFNCDGNGSCPEPETEADCDAVGEALGGAECTLDDSCECIVPNEMCNGNCNLEVNGVFWCSEE